MGAVRRRLLPLPLVLGLAACGGHAAKAPSVSASPAQTTGAGSAKFGLTVVATLSGTSLRTEESGTVSFRSRRAHVFRTTTQGEFVEVIYDGAVEYSNANAAASVSQPGLKPWLRIRSHGATDVEHVQVLAYLPAGATAVEQLGSEKVDGAATTHFRAMIDPERAAGPMTPRQRTALAADFGGKRFPAELWLDSNGRLRRVRISRASASSRVTIEARFSEFGAKVDVTPPPADEIGTAPG